MFLSIIIPIYNDEKFLNECLDSCLDQDYPQDDYEIICVDDGSTDRTPEMLREYAEKHPNIRLVFKAHGGRGGRSVGFEQANGDYIWFVDHDDIVAPNALPDLKAAADANPESDRIQFSYYQFFDALSKEEVQLLKSGKLLPNDHDRYRDMVIWDNIIKMSFLKEHQIYPRSKRVDAAGAFWGIHPFYVFGGDKVFTEECLDNNVKTVILEGRPLYHYRRHDQTETLDPSPEKVQLRAKQKYHTALLNLFLALQNKQAYLDQRSENGAADPETAIRAVVSIRKAASALAILPKEYWNEGMRLAKEKEAFFPKHIPEYTFGYLDYLKLKPIGERIKLETSAQYYSYTELGTRLFRALSLGNSRLLSASFWKNNLTAWRKRYYQIKGTSNSGSKTI